MRLATFRTTNGLRSALVTPEGAIDLHATNPELPASLKSLLAGGFLPRVQELLAGRTHVPIQGERTTPIPDPSKIVCMGMNYRDHVAEFGRAIPTEPVLFAKFLNSLIGPNEAIVIPSIVTQADYEAELVLVVGKTAKNVPEDDRAYDYLAGVTCGNDISARDWQYRGEKQWTLGKTFDTFAPVGPDLVTLDENSDLHNLPVTCRLNGKVMQNSSTKEFIFRVPTILAYVSQAIRLEPGDLIFTGTPPGVGIARKPPVTLQPGDEVEVEIGGVGILCNRCE